MERHSFGGMLRAQTKHNQCVFWQRTISTSNNFLVQTMNGQFPDSDHQIFVYYCA